MGERSKPVSPTTEIPSPPNVWSHLTEASTQSEIDAADVEHFAWLKSERGLSYLEWDRKVVAYANENGCDYHEAMEALHVKFT